MKKVLKNKYIIIMFILFLIFLIIQHQFLYLYHDDYGYASLSYAVDVKNVVGHNFNFSDAINFLGQHYNSWGGRILFFFAEVMLLGTSLEAFRIVQSIVIFLIFVLIYLIGKDNLKITDWKIALTTIMLYGVFNIFVIRDGIFWITASVLYVFPILFVLSFVYFYNKYKDYHFVSRTKEILFKVFCIFLVFCASFSQEQIAAAMVFYVFIISIII
jgi:hypothetical protein